MLQSALCVKMDITLMTSLIIALPVQSIVRITYAIVAIEHVRVDVCLEVQDIGVSNNVQLTVANVNNLIRRNAYLVKVDFMATDVKICAAKLAIHQPECANALKSTAYVLMAAILATGVRLAQMPVLLDALI